jgi:catechol 2,3-dioxygenase-like lactoylglutathione lyase family enzyme
MSSGRGRGLDGMTSDSPTKTTLNNIGVAMFTVGDQDEAIAFYVETLGFELRGDTTFGENGDMRWVEVAPVGSTARLALNPDMGGQPTGAAIGVETPDVLGEHARLAALGLEVGPTPEQVPGAPLLFMAKDPWGNHIAVVEAPAAG